MKRFRTVLQFLPRYRRFVFLGFACLIASRSLALTQPLILGSAMDQISLGPAMDRDYLRELALLFVGVSAVLATYHFGMRWYLITTSRRLERDLRRHLFAHLTRLSPAFYHRRATGDLMSRASSDVEQVRLALGPGVMYIANTIFMVPIALVVLLGMSPSLTAFSLLPLAGIALVTKVLAPRMHRHSRRVQEAAASLSTRAQESFAGARVVKVFAREDNEVREFTEEARSYLDASMGLARVRALLRPSLQALEGVGSLVLLFVGGRLVIDTDLSFGELFSFFIYQRMLVWPMIAIGWVIALFQRGAAAMERIDEILTIEPEIADAATTVDAGTIRGEVEFRDLTFSYGAGPVLTQVNVKVPAGSSLAVVGPTGCGKSTLVELLLRMYPVPEGTIFVDGVDVGDLPLDRLRGAVGYAPQETFLFSDTLRENIAFGVADASDEEVLAAATRSQLAADVEEFPKGYDTMLGERGVNLSGGQKQRAALARAIIRNPPILVLDDSFSSVDTSTEEKILGELREVMAGRTTILIGHRVSTVRHADRIVVMEEGRIVERGTHEELIEDGGRYARMEKLQRLSEELDSL